ncbi:MAG: SPASM domain-containing protein, partial [Candidatus Omnitrophota bacterium]
AEIHNHMRQTPGAFKSAVNTIEKLRSRYSRKQLYLAINHTLTNENYLCIEDMCKLAQDLDVDYRCFIALEKRPLYSNTRPIDYHVVKLTHTAKAAIVHQLDHLYLNTNWMKPSRDTLEKLVFRQYIGGQLKLLKNIRPHHRCMNLFTHFRLNPNGDIIPCSYDTKVLGNIKNETYSNVMAKQITKEKLRTIKKCGKCWLGCEVAPNWISSLGR